MSQSAINMPAKRGESGFTLIELMVTLAVMAILIAAALPAFRSFVVTQRVKSTSFDLMSVLVYARSEAIKRDTNVVVTPNGGSWLNGWNVAAGATSLKVGAALGSGVAVACFQGGVVASTCPTLTFNSSGRLVGGGAPSIQLGSSETTGPLSQRCIKIDLSGRPLSQKGAC